MPPETPTTPPSDPEFGRPLPYFVRRLDDNRLAFYLDHHLIDTFNQCERMFFLKHIEHLRAKGMSKAMSIGIWWSRTMELFYNQVASNQVAKLAPPTKEEMLAFATLAWQETKMDDLAMYDPEAFAKFGGLAGGILMSQQYYDRQAMIDFSGWKVIAAERGFGIKGELCLYEDAEIVIYYMGKPDLVVLATANDVLQPVDHKTIDRIDGSVQKKYKPHPQTAGYIWAVGELSRQLGFNRIVDRCIINVAARSEPSEKPRDGKVKPRFTRVYPSYSPDEIEEWRRGIIEKTRRLLYCLRNNVWLWRESTCHQWSGCSFRSIDALPPESRQYAIKADFVEVEPWAPYKEED